ncbi:MAG TPA: DNA repair protein RadA [Steroidobacteraceae bacterium]|jgi:DNA repair protein RadA/Sms|nr:DNA repair protein RadA [Steroidobacteraceae bacterium]
MARPNAVFVCSSCGGETLKWQGQCPLCGEWNTLEQRAGGARVRAAASAAAVSAAAVSLGEHAEAGPGNERLGTGHGELDRVLGGGLVAGSVTLLGGDPGIGKSTLLLQVAAHLAAGHPVIYASGEESVAQVAARARRLALGAKSLGLVAQTDLAAIMALAEERRAALLVIDSIQTVQVGAAPSAAGSVSQLRECTAELVRFAKGSGCAVMIVGHVTKEGTLAGPRMLEHLVDTVLYFQSETASRYRIVRATKNRFGAANELGFFAMSAAGLKEVKNPAAIFLARASEPAAGSIVTVTREGGRPLLIELQALVDRMRFGAPRRVAQGLDANRLAMLLAAANRHAGLSLQEHDVFVNVVGGIEITETAWDLPVLVALASSLRDHALPTQLVAFGELGLTGEVRPVPYGDERLREAQAQGFRLAIVPRENAPRRPVAGLEVIGVARLDAALAAALGAARA